MLLRYIYRFHSTFIFTFLCCRFLRCIFVDGGGGDGVFVFVLLMCLDFCFVWGGIFCFRFDFFFFFLRGFFCTWS